MEYNREKVIEKAKWYEENASFDATVNPDIRYSQDMEGEAKVLFTELAALIDINRDCIVRDEYFEEVGINVCRVPGLVEQLQYAKFIKPLTLIEDDEVGIIRYYKVLRGI